MVGERVLVGVKVIVGVAVLVRVFVGVLVKVIVGVLDGVGVKVKVQVFPGYPQGVLLGRMVKVDVGAGGRGAAGPSLTQATGKNQSRHGKSKAKPARQMVRRIIPSL